MRRGHRHLLAWVLGAACAGPALAGSFGVSPVRLTLAAGRGAVALTVRNTGPEACVIQLDLQAWSQRDGVDVLEPTRELLANPPLFALAPGGVQIVRVGLRGRAPDAQRELAYRLLLKEVPQPATPSDKGLRMALNVSLPVFVLPIAPAAPDLHWSARRTDGPHRTALAAVNSGNAHVQLNGVRLAGGAPAAPAVTGYLLPGQRRAWAIDHDAPVGATLHLVALTDAGELPADAPVAAAP